MHACGVRIDNITTTNNSWIQLQICTWGGGQGDAAPVDTMGKGNCLYKKINYIAKVVDKIVSHEQTAFIAGRQILDGPLILSEAIDWYKKRKKKMILFKVDFEKSFDSVSWRLFQLEQEKNYLILDCIRNGQWSWNWSQNILGVRNTAYLNNLLMEIGQLEAETDKDKYVWSLAHNGVFSVKDLYDKAKKSVKSRAMDKDHEMTAESEEEFEEETEEEEKEDNSEHFDFSPL
nr:RNA-directed DNA polymerase, eukaryota, reverse transcriptase zinc-binding domain protein [Tanacetum cinerariifolium]